MYRTAIVGCGPRATTHAMAYEHVRAGRLVACCDLDRQRLDAFGERFGIEDRFTDLASMLAAAQPDLLHIVTAPQARWSVVEVALHHALRGILVEKPLANRPSEGYCILDACAQAGVALFVNHQLRHHLTWRLVRALVQEGAVGPIQSVRASCRGNLLDQGTHLFDLVSFLLGEAPGFEPAAGKAETLALQAMVRPWLVAQATGAQGYDASHSAPEYTAGVLALTPQGHVSFECGPDAPTWPGEENDWLQFGIEISGRDGRVGGSLNHGWWLQTLRRTEGDTVPYLPEDLHAEARLIESALQSLDDPSTHPNNAARSRVSFDLVMAAQRAALRRSRVVPGEPVKDDEIEALRAALEAAEQ
jgi:predicted dehydrogenase